MQFHNISINSNAYIQIIADGLSDMRYDDDKCQSSLLASGHIQESTEYLRL